jgi:hypothetical protein
MSAGKLSRLAGLVFVLAAFLGGGGAYVPGAEHGTGGYTINDESGNTSGVAPSSSPTSTVTTFDVDWS